MKCPLCIYDENWCGCEHVTTDFYKEIELLRKASAYNLACAREYEKQIEQLNDKINKFYEPELEILRDYIERLEKKNDMSNM